MPQIIQHKRRINPGAIGGPATLAPGEFAYNANGHSLHVGSGAAVVEMVGVGRQLEIIGGDQTVASGIKTWAAGAKLAIGIADLRIPGGNANEMIRTDGAGNLSFAPGLAAAQLFVGAFNATTGAVRWVAGMGTGNALPAPVAGNAGWYLICDTAGNVPPAGTIIGATIYNIGDWIMSSGTSWEHLAFGGISTGDASMIPVMPPLTGGTVQGELERLEAGKVAIAGSTMTGLLILSGPPTDPLGAVTKTYADGADALRVLKAGDTMTGPLALPVAAPTLPEQAANKKYVDDVLSSAIGGGTTVTVKGPELIGTGLAASPIEFTGVTVAANSTTSLLGSGLSTAGLDLVLVDGGEY